MAVLFLLKRKREDIIPEMLLEKTLNLLNGYECPYLLGYVLLVLVPMEGNLLPYGNNSEIHIRAGTGQDDPRRICHISKQGCFSELTGVMSKGPRSHGEEAPSTPSGETFVFSKKIATVSWNTKHKFLKFTMIP